MQRDLQECWRSAGSWCTSISATMWFDLRESSPLSATLDAHTHIQLVMTHRFPLRSVVMSPHPKSTGKSICALKHLKGEQMQQAAAKLSSAVNVMLTGSCTRRRCTTSKCGRMRWTVRCVGRAPVPNRALLLSAPLLLKFKEWQPKDVTDRCKRSAQTSSNTTAQPRKQVQDCGGSSICEHSRRRSKCKQCGGSSICSRQRRQCKILI